MDFSKINFNILIYFFISSSLFEASEFSSRAISGIIDCKVIKSFNYICDYSSNLTIFINYYSSKYKLLYSSNKSVKLLNLNKGGVKKSFDGHSGNIQYICT